MLPNLDDFEDEVSDEARRELVLALKEVFKDLRKQDINFISLADIFILLGYEPDTIDQEDFDFELDLTAVDDDLFAENYLGTTMRDKLN